MGSLLSVPFGSRGLAVYTSLKSWALLLPCLRKAERPSGLSAENGRTSYQMLRQQVELMLHVKVLNTLGSSDSPEPCYKVVTPVQVKDTRTNRYRAKQLPNILQGATLRHQES